jgi:hypothetical protein
VQFVPELLPLRKIRCDVTLQSHRNVGELVDVLVDSDQPKLHLTQASIEPLDTFEQFCPDLFQSQHCAPSRPRIATEMPPQHVLDAVGEIAM